MAGRVALPGGLAAKVCSPYKVAVEVAEVLTAVGKAGFEPTTPCSQSRCATRLRHFPYLKS